MVEIEKFMLCHILRWRLSYATPYEFIQLITERIGMDKPVPTLPAIQSKAKCLADLLLLCNPRVPAVAIGKSALRPPLAIGIAALVTACLMMDERELSERALLFADSEISVILPRRDTE